MDNKFCCGQTSSRYKRGRATVFAAGCRYVSREIHFMPSIYASKRTLHFFYVAITGAIYVDIIPRWRSLPAGPGNGDVSIDYFAVGIWWVLVTSNAMAR